jgi:hypothetical protein
MEYLLPFRFRQIVHQFLQLPPLLKPAQRFQQRTSRFFHDLGDDASPKTNISVISKMIEETP